MKFNIGDKVTISQQASEGAGQQAVVDCFPLLHNRVTSGRPGDTNAWSICQRIGSCTVKTADGRRFGVYHDHLLDPITEEA